MSAITQVFVRTTLYATIQMVLITVSANLDIPKPQMANVKAHGLFSPSIANACNVFTCHMKLIDFVFWSSHAINYKRQGICWAHQQFH